MLNAVILTRGALEVADEIRPFLELDDEFTSPSPLHRLDPSPGEPLEFAILLQEAGLACQTAA